MQAAVGLAQLKKLPGFIKKRIENFNFLYSLFKAVSYTHLRAHETPEHLVCRLLLEKKK